jgi:hypothetical protein
VREDNLAGHWIFGISARHVRDVLVAGEIAVRDRRLARGDEEHRAIAQSEAVELWDRMDRIPPHPFEPAGRS